MVKVNIKGIDKIKLLKILWQNQKVTGINASIFQLTEEIINIKMMFNTYKANYAVQSYIDYFEGKAIKTDISKDIADSFLYDRDAGEGVFQKCVDKLRKKKQY